MGLFHDRFLGKVAKNLIFVTFRCFLCPRSLIPNFIIVGA